MQPQFRGREEVGKGLFKVGGYGRGGPLMKHLTIAGSVSLKWHPRPIINIVGSGPFLPSSCARMCRGSAWGSTNRGRANRLTPAFCTGAFRKRSCTQNPSFPTTRTYAQTGTRDTPPITCHKARRTHRLGNHFEHVDFGCHAKGEWMNIRHSFLA